MTVKLSENQVALILSYAPDQKFADVIGDARIDTKREWEQSDGSRAEKIDQILAADVYDFEQLGWEIIRDRAPEHDELVMACVTPVPDYHESDAEYDLDEITRQFVYEFREAAIDAVDEVRQRTGLRPRLFTAAMVDLDEDVEPGTDSFDEVAACMGYTEHGLTETIDAANEKVSEARTLFDLTAGEKPLL
jgi:hypothetical protein